MPTLRYMFGDEEDFPLQQARAYLLGKDVITHDETQAKLKAERKAKEAAANAKDKAGKSAATEKQRAGEASDAKK